MIATLLVTIIIESGVVAVYSGRWSKPASPLLLTTLCANLITQSLLWIGLNLFFDHYLITLFIAEFLIWIVEGFLLYSIPANRLQLMDAALLSLGMNLSSFALGWFLPL